jgi:hypothetical protein
VLQVSKRIQACGAEEAEGDQVHDDVSHVTAISASRAVGHVML